MRKRDPKKFIRMIGILTLFTMLISLTAPALYVQAAGPELRLNVKSKILVKDTTYSLKVYNLSEGQTVNFKSDDTSIASVDDTGLVTAAASGTVPITATVKEGIKTVVQLQCEITVGPPAISVKLTQPTVILMLGKKAMLKTILQPLNTAENVKFSSFRSSIVSVSSGGRITARSLGSTYIFAAIDNGKYDFCKVIVVDEDAYLTLLENPAINPETLVPTESDDTDTITEPNDVQVPENTTDVPSSDIPTEPSDNDSVVDNTAEPPVETSNNVSVNTTPDVSTITSTPAPLI